MSGMDSTGKSGFGASPSGVDFDDEPPLLEGEIPLLFFAVSVD